MQGWSQGGQVAAAATRRILNNASIIRKNNIYPQLYRPATTRFFFPYLLLYKKSLILYFILFLRMETQKGIPKQNSMGQSEKL